MRILVVGSGGREHAICSAFAKSPLVSKIYCADGNAGIALIAERVPIRPDRIRELLAFASGEGVDLTFIGGETALALGIADLFESAGLSVVGARYASARLEASKSYAKDFMARHGIPTAGFRVAATPDEAAGIVRSGYFGDESAPLVVKADGLAAGKGVVVAPTRAGALAAIRTIVSDIAAEAVERIVLEECLFGREVSLLAFCDGRTYRLMPPVRDHKRIHDGDRGPNTGGMGTVADRGLLSADDLSRIEREILGPTLDGCIADGHPFSGILFVGLMMTGDGPRVLEYNVRFGDPETQVILPLLESDFAGLCKSLAAGTLGEFPVEWSDRSAACVVLAAHGYPGTPQRGDIVYGLDLAERHADTFVFHAGTEKDEKGHFITAGGRVLGVTAVGADLAGALDRAYLAVNDLSWNGMQFRHDIGR